MFVESSSVAPSIVNFGTGNSELFPFEISKKSSDISSDSKSYWDVGIYIVHNCQKGTEIDENVGCKIAFLTVDRWLRNDNNSKFKHSGF